MAGDGMRQVQPEVRGSHRALNQAIGRYRAVVAHYLNRSVDVVDRWCLPQPRPTPTGCNYRGRPNPLDVLQTVLSACEHPEVAQEWLAEQWGYRLAPRPQGEHAERVARLAERLCEALNGGDEAALVDLRDQLIEAVHAAVAERQEAGREQ